jgi:type IV pilus assembly PilX-like protein
MTSSPNDIGVTDAARRQTDRRGIALVTALFCIVVIALVISGAFFTSTQEFRGTRNELVEQRAFAIAEYGLNSEISNWDRTRNLPGGMAVGAIDSTKIYPAAGDTAWVKVTRLSDRTFWVVSEGEANIGRPLLESRRQTNAYVRIAYPSVKPKGAITAAGNVKINGSAVVDGRNTDPPGWSQCADIPGSTVPAIVVPPGSNVQYNSSNIPSTPAVVYDPAAGDSNTYVRYGSESWNSLKANADILLPGGDYGTDIFPVGTATTCDRSNQLNWGEPWRPAVVAGCKDYFPIIYSNNDLHVNGTGRGQGILLVNGDLIINGQFEWYGLIVVRDDISKSNGTAKIMGAVYAANLQLNDPTWVNGNQDIFYSKCAIESALRGSAILVRVMQRGWAQVY